MTPIIEVSVDEAGNISYRMRPSSLDTKAYGEIFATLVRLVAQMMESEAGYKRAVVISQIFEAFLKEMNAPTAEVKSAMLQ